MKINKLFIKPKLYRIRPGKGHFKTILAIELDKPQVVEFRHYKTGEIKTISFNQGDFIVKCPESNFLYPMTRKLFNKFTYLQGKEVINV